MESAAHNGLRDARKRAKLSQAALAERVGSFQPNVARYEAGTMEPGVKLAVRLARAVGTTVEAIWWPDEQSEVGAT